MQRSDAIREMYERAKAGDTDTAFELGTFSLLGRNLFTDIVENLCNLARAENMTPEITLVDEAHLNRFRIRVVLKPIQP